MTKQKIIIDTDVGGDIDDVWALCLALASPELDVRLISVSEGDTDYKARLARAILDACGRPDIPVAKGYDYGLKEYPQAGLLSDAPPNAIAYRAAYEQILASDVTVVGLSPYTSLSTVADLVVARGSRVVAMAGSIDRGYFGKAQADPECNIAWNVAAARRFFSERPAYTMLPLDVCGDLVLCGEGYRTVRESVGRFARCVMRHYDEWDKRYIGGARKADPKTSSSILYDLAPIWLLLYPDRFTVVPLDIDVTDDGRTARGSDFSIRAALRVEGVDEMLRDTARRLCE